MKVLTCLFVALLLPIAFAAGQSWQEQYVSAQRLYESNDLTGAYQQGLQCLENYLKESGELSDNYAAILRLLENICYDNGDLEKGLEFVQKEVAIRATSKDTDYASALSQHAAFSRALQDYETAGKLFREAFEIVSKFHLPSETPVIEARLSIAINAYLADDGQEAYFIFNEVLSLYRERNSMHTQASYFFAQLCIERGEYPKALESLLTVKEFYESQQMDHTSEYASVLYNLGLCYHHTQDLSKAEEQYFAAQQLYEALNDKDSDYLSLINARGLNLVALGRAEEAEKLFSQSPKTGQNVSTAALLANKAGLNMAKGNFSEAERDYAAALSNLNKSNRDDAKLYVSVLQSLSVLFDETGRLSLAEKAINEADSLSALVYSNNAIEFASIRINKGNVLLKKDKHEEAFALFDEARKIIEMNNRIYESEWIKAMNGIGLVLYTSGDVKGADSIYSLLHAAYGRGTLKKDINYPAILNNYAALTQLSGEFLSARQLLAQAASFLKRQFGSSDLRYARAIENLAYINLDLGDLTAAKTELDSSLYLYEKLLGKNSVPYLTALIHLGKYHQYKGEYGLAEPCFRNAYQEIVASKNVSVSDIVNASNSLALFYQTMGNYDEAEPLLKQAITFIVNASRKNSPEYSTAIQNLATLYQLQEKNDLAAPLLEEALAIDRRIYGENHPRYIVILKNLAALYQKTGRLDQAKTLLTQALDATRSVFGDEHTNTASVLANLAALYQDQKNFQEAEKLWRQSVALRKQLLGEEHSDYARSLYGLANVYFAQEKYQEAAEYYETVANFYLKQVKENFPWLSEKEKGAFYLKIKPVFEAYQDFCIQRYMHNPADVNALTDLYNIQLATKAILLNASNKVRNNIASSGDAALINTFQKWLSLKEEIVRYYTLSSEERQNQKDVNVLIREANDLEKYLSQASTEFQDHLSKNEYTLKHVSSALAEDEAAVEIVRLKRKFTTDSIYYAALVVRKHSDTPSLVLWPNGKDIEGRTFRFHRNAIKHQIPDTISYPRYWRPLEKALTDIKNVYLSCDGIFNKVNLNTIHNPSTSQWVIDNITVHLISNTKELAGRTTDAQSSLNSIALYGHVDFQLDMTAGSRPITRNTIQTRTFGFENEIPVLPGTEKEVDQIQRIFEEKQYQVFRYVKADATEDNIKKATHTSILHIATHGFFLNDVEISDREADDREDFFSNPLMRSGILLAGAGVKRSEAEKALSEDGVLTAYEVMNIDLTKTDMVVLSACETGLGEVRNGEGVYGLQRSLMVAGAEAVIMSLWQVDDVATQELMVNFYHHLLNGETKHNAFRKAQLLMKEKYPSPFYWGAFVLIGA